MSLLNHLYKDILKKADGKFRTYYSNCSVEGEKCLLLYDNDGCDAQFMPGTMDIFCLKKYDQTGKDYKRIILYLCTESDFEESENHDISQDEEAESLDDLNDCDLCSFEPVAKKQCVIGDDEMIAIQIQTSLGEEYVRLDQSSPARHTQLPTSESFVNHLSKAVDDTEQFFIIIRRGTS